MTELLPRQALAIVACIPLLAVSLLAVLGAELSRAAEPDASEASGVDFGREVLPILSNHCFQCHGPDENTREAGLRLDVPEAAYEDLGGYQAIVSHDPDASLVIERVTSDDPDAQMPPADSELELSSEQIDVLRRWIADGARYDQHWSFQPVVAPPIPAVMGSSANVDAGWARGPLDAFVLGRLREAGLRPAAEADRRTEIRRVYLDLLGLTPPPEVVDAFVRDESPDAYETMLDRAFADVHYGERWGRHWLDQARYADTHGFSVDTDRPIWPYRDWVIDAINADKPFDQFSIEQLAGDLLPEPTQDQLIATGFHRNTLVNQEGGSDAEQFRNEAVVYCANTTGAVWLGLTVGCAQCHTHKFDPLTHHEYYQLFAFFNSGQDVNSTTPTLRLATDEQRQRMAEMDAEIEGVRTRLAELKALQPAPKTDATAESQGAESAAEDEEARLATEAAIKAVDEELQRLTKARKDYENQIPETMVMADLEKPRETHVHIRGDFLRLGDPVEPDVPAVLPPLTKGDGPATRLDLARWLVDRENPLTARVTVNRAWMRLFGNGLVETENDFGLQGTPPTHPELLDWLATELMDHDWSMKYLQRLVLTSATYRQSSKLDPAVLAADPLNQLLARQMRLRVEAETVRDVALSASGLLDHRIGGKSVYPPQPGGVYAFTQRGASWPTSTGGDRNRRGLYTFFMRSAPYPMLTTFDVPNFNTTCTRRSRSNTPLQSLTMANAEPMLESALALGQRILREEQDNAKRIEFAYLVCFSRLPSEQEAVRLLRFVENEHRNFVESPEAANAFIAQLSAGSAAPVDPAATAELAAWTSAARVLLNLDEFITRE